MNGDDIATRRRCRGTVREAEAVEDLRFATARIRMEVDSVLAEVEAGSLDPVLVSSAFDAARVIIEARVAFKPPLRSHVTR